MTKPSKSTVKKSAVTTAAARKSAPTKVSIIGQSKQVMLITLLKRTSGATIEEMMKVTGWQQHSVRGVLSGVLKKKLGLSVSSAQEERGRIYRISA